MPTTNDQPINTAPKAENQDLSLNLGTNGSTPVSNTDESLNFNINLDEASPDNMVNPVDINKEPEIKTISESSNLGTANEGVKYDDSDLNLPDSFFVSGDAGQTKDKKSDIDNIGINDVSIGDNQTSPTDDTSWLHAQDQQNKEEEKTILTGNISGVQIATNTNQSGVNDIDPEKTNYSSDMKIIDEINNANTLQEKINSETVVTETTQTPSDVSENDGVKHIETQVKNDNIDLDVLINNSNNQTQSGKPEVNVIKNNGLYPDLLNQVTNSNVDNAGEIGGKEELNPVGPDLSMGVVAQDGPVIVKKSSILGRFLIPAIVIVVVGILAYYVFTTMYPLESGNIIENVSPQIAEVNTGESETGNVDTEVASGDTITETGVILEETGVISEETGHGAADEEFTEGGESIGDGILPEEEQTPQSNLEKIKSIAEEANTFLEEGKSTNNKTYMKYGIAIYKKCNELVAMLENGQEITNLTGNLAQLDGYLQKLRDIKDNATSNGEQGSAQSPAETPEDQDIIQQ